MSHIGSELSLCPSLYIWGQWGQFPAPLSLFYCFDWDKGDRKVFVALFDCPPIEDRFIKMGHFTEVDKEQDSALFSLSWIIIIREDGMKMLRIFKFPGLSPQENEIPIQ